MKYYPIEFDREGFLHDLEAMISSLKDTDDKLLKPAIEELEKFKGEHENV
jgi:hypothetical protein